MQVKIERTEHDILEISRFGLGDSGGGVYRQGFSKADMEATALGRVVPRDGIEPPTP